MDLQTLASVCKMHGLIIADVLRRLGAKRIPLERIQFVVDDAGLEYLVCDRHGYQIVKEVDVEAGTISMHAVPGHFAVLGGGTAIWKPDENDAVFYRDERTMH